MKNTKKSLKNTCSHCAGCPGAEMETIEQAAEGHGLDLEKLLADLNGA